MRKLFTVAAAAVALAAASAVFAAPPPQVAPPAQIRVAPAPALVPEPAASSGAPWSHDAAATTLQRLLRDRGYGEDVLFGPMTAWAPGDDGYLDAPRTGDPRLDAPLGGRPAGAWFVDTNAGGFWVWDYGAAAPADRLAEILEGARARQGRLLGAPD
jgi:hypothetical protein